MNKEKNLNINNINYNENEIAKFEAYASNWWDINGPCKLLHSMNALRLSWILQHSNGLFGKKILDVGCGGGILSESMAREGANVTGLDMSVKALRVAKSHALKKGLNINYLQETIENHIGQYDVITCMEILEHVPKPCSIVQACANLVNPGGQVFFSTINRNSKAWLIVILGAEYILRMLPIGTHDFKKFIRPSELLSWVDKTILNERHIIGIHYNPLTDKFKLAPGIDVHYMIHTSHTGI